MSADYPFPEVIQKDSWMLRIYRGADAALPVVYLHIDGESSDRVAFQCRDCCTLVGIEGADWNRDFSPWPAMRAFRKGEDFSGGADAYLLRFRNKLIPAVEKVLDMPNCLRAIAGYSLAGLFALYAMYRCTDFSGAASISGSLWYDGFAEYACSHSPAQGVYYLSLGNREHLGKNPRMASVRTCTNQIAERLSSFGRVYRQENPGGHFTDAPGRISDGIHQLCHMLSGGVKMPF